MKLILNITEKENARAETCLMFFPYHGETRRINESKRLCTCCLMPRIEKCSVVQAREAGEEK